MSIKWPSWRFLVELQLLAAATHRIVAHDGSLWFLLVYALVLTSWACWFVLWCFRKLDGDLYG